MAERQKLTPALIPFLPVRVRARVNRFLLSQVGNVFAAGMPELDASARLWRVPILYNPPDFVVGEVGEVQVSAITGEIHQHTPVAEMHERAAKLHDRHQAQIRAAFLRARKNLHRAREHRGRFHWQGDLKRMREEETYGLGRSPGRYQRPH